MRHLLLIAFALLATPAFAGECHFSGALPVVSDWTITPTPGGLVVDARIARRCEWCPAPSTTYCVDDGPRWFHVLALRPAGSSGAYDVRGCLGAVTDSTLHFDLAYPAGEYEYSAYVDGWYDSEERDRCEFPPYAGTITITDPTPVRRVSWGAVKGRWR